MGLKEENAGMALPQNRIAAYPVPFKNRVTISVAEEGFIYSITGQLIVSLKKGKNEIKTDEWSEGVYIITSGRESLRIVKLK
ncbi:MAG: T9SS type A sorting domain-containing protein [Candidatus Coatesbacteria bacterium]|nr:T9SS type A sorting domain-containing protein [Candidatus Coatesbacteria bacterium]